MQVVANQKLVRNRSRLAWVLYLAAMGVFLLGLLVNSRAGLEPPPDLATAILPWGTIAVGMVLWFAALSQLRRWGPRQRQDRVLGEAMSGLDDRYKLYAHLATSLPDFILVGPGGVHVLVARAEAGNIMCLEDRWKKAGQSALTALFETPLGNPSLEAEEQVKRLRSLLDAEGLQDVPAGALVVFTDDRVKLRVEGCSYPVTRARRPPRDRKKAAGPAPSSAAARSSDESSPQLLKDVLTRLAGRGKNVALSAAQIRQVQALFDRRMQGARAWR